MKKKIKAIKARKCSAYFFDGKTNKYFCFGVPEPFSNPSCNGYKCKCTEYKHDPIQRITIKGQEYEVNKRTGEIIPLCHWLSHDTRILENICCDGKGRCKCIMKEGADNE